MPYSLEVRYLSWNANITNWLSALTLKHSTVRFFFEDRSWLQEKENTEQWCSSGLQREEGWRRRKNVGKVWTEGTWKLSSANFTFCLVLLDYSVDVKSSGTINIMLIFHFRRVTVYFLFLSKLSETSILSHSFFAPSLANFIR